MDAVLKPRLSVVWSTDFAKPNSVSAYATFHGGDGVVTVRDLDVSDLKLVDFVLFAAEALGAEVVEVNEHLRPVPRKL